jgi:hypothetical protein
VLLEAEHRVHVTVANRRCVVQDLVPDFMKFVTRPIYGVVLRYLGACLLVVGIVAAGLDAKWAGFTPVVWFLLALVAFLGVICNELAQVIGRMGVKRHAEAADWHKAPEEPAALVAGPESGKPAEPSWLEVEIYCVKCRDRRKIRNPETVTLANGRSAYQGPCPVCGTKVTRILKAG